MNNFSIKEIRKRQEELSKNFAQHGPLKGTMILTPYGTRIWKRIQAEINREHEKLGVKEVMMPSIFPLSMLEKGHGVSFEKGLLLVDKIGKNKLLDPIVLRPTSEALFCLYFAENIQSYRDLPLLLNQWSNAIRWETTNKLLIRGNEFWWHEGHAVFHNYYQADLFVKKLLSMYEDFIVKKLNLAINMGVKTRYEKFAGAKITYTFEMLLPDKQVLQLATIHKFGSVFAKKYGVEFRDKKNNLCAVQQVSWGISTRILGAICSHYDRDGLILSSSLASPQIVVILIRLAERQIMLINNENEGSKFSNEKKRRIGELRVKKMIDKLKEMFIVSIKVIKFTSAYMILSKLRKRIRAHGIPLIVEVGEKEVDGSYLSVWSRLSNEREYVEWGNFESILFKRMMEKIDEYVYRKAVDFKNSNTYEIGSSKSKLLKCIEDGKSGLFKTYFCGRINCEKKVKRLFFLSSSCTEGNLLSWARCFECGFLGSKLTWFGRSY